MPIATAAGERVLTVGTHLTVDNTVTTSKYTALNFLPKNLAEQFRRLANIYFLIISILQLATDLSPTSKYATAGPLFIIVTISAIKEAVEDVARHKDDHAANHQEAIVMDATIEKIVPWCDVRCGQILKVKEGQSFPADLMLLMSTRDDGKCHIQTAELDGETNLKIKQTQPDILEIGSSDHTAFDATAYAGGLLEYEHPNNRLYEFRGKYTLKGQTLPVKNDNILLRGAMLKNTDALWGLVVYTGVETKLSMNMTKGAAKMSDVERMVNRCIFVIFFALLVICAVSTATGFDWIDENKSAPYVPFLGGMGVGTKLLNFVTYLILYNNLVPISLYVSLEMCKLFMASAVSRDHKMYYAPKNMWAAARTSNIPEDLGQIQYIFRYTTLPCGWLWRRCCGI
jgi:phospholipid-transporting ATPase